MKHLEHISLLGWLLLSSLFTLFQTSKALSETSLDTTKEAGRVRHSAYLEGLRELKDANGWTFDVDYSDALDIPLEQRTGLVLPDNWRENAMFLTPKVSTYDMPRHFDWRDMAGGLTPVKYQGNCGSCWAFATAGVFENVLRIRDAITKDLSEQYLVSCNQSGYSCGGGWWAHDLHQQFGLVPESKFPYEASDVQCKQNLSHEEKITKWAFVGGEEDVPPVDKIKEALYTYGPIAVAVAASGSFSAYKSGVFNDCSGGSINHAVVLVGWDDDEGYWIMRNSWGPEWGDNGYMKIKYDCNQIGYAASFVVYEPKCNPQPEASPGPAQVVKKGSSVKLGSTPIIDQKYSWTPAAGLDNPSLPQPTAKPDVDTIYTLTVKTACGSASSSVKVTVHP